ncbi:endonuclease/exonuclease/phosphatase family protein [Aspergillus brunneoviolaceus CBS 621.78]|uniref:Endonuclease/exonuclease/phosphatase family protein n=1 Tax=Aspergillus brunneoviolaceus CBS 621.78 TaxID=1450534 RepID=A0ACD1FZR8_9EURO|nr:endonuclease/exonuclease/phosphatase family protein [Aspergillus brunneoviolaceus CBS 621.78]RAH42474.1 endonuclease/exonuclease/phosphatase family protein [Aspergillus brunneoviolaceus CBS 621.78]
MRTSSLSTVALLVQTAVAVTINEITGDRYISPYAGTEVTGLEGLVTAKGSSGFYLRSTSPDSDDKTSNSVYVYGSSATKSVTVGDIITLSGKVTEYRSTSSYVYLTEIESATDITVVSSGNTVTPIVIGGNGRSPPTEQFTSLDNGDPFSLPGNSSQLSTANPVLDTTAYGMDFWQSLTGEFVSLSGLTAISKANSYGDTWVIGDWTVSGKNERGGLTMTANDSNPEALIVGSPLDGSKNPTDVKLGDALGDITGIITQAYGYYALLPSTALSVTSSNATEVPKTSLISNKKCKITFGDYNVDNLGPDSSTLPGVAGHIANYLQSPDIVFLQEIQDNDGSTNDGVVSANVTLSTLVSSIVEQGGVQYEFFDIDPVDGTNGGESGGNIRCAYLYNPEVVQLRDANPGTSTTGTTVKSGGTLSYNPGLIDPTNEAWDASRKPLVAQWERADGRNTFYTINVHLTSKYGSTSLEGDLRPPVNGDVEKRASQLSVIADFVGSLFAEVADARVIVAGDYNEYSFTDIFNVFTEVGLQEIDEVAGLAATERYTYLYDQNSEQLDHMFISSALATGAKVEHVHVNTWVSTADQSSDHDATVAQMNVCQ